jgi:hypothetical protein
VAITWNHTVDSFCLPKGLGFISGWHEAKVLAWSAMCAVWFAPVARHQVRWRLRGQGLGFLPGLRCAPTAWNERIDSFCLPGGLGFISGLRCVPLTRGEIVGLECDVCRVVRASRKTSSWVEVEASGASASASFLACGVRQSQEVKLVTASDCARASALSPACGVRRPNQPKLLAWTRRLSLPAGQATFLSPASSESSKKP